MDNAKNFAKATVSTGYDAVATSIVLTTGHGAKLPTAPFNLAWWNATDYPDPSDDPNVEIVRCTAIATDTLTITRAQEGTSGSTKNTASKTYKMIAGLTAKVINTDLQPKFLSFTPSVNRQGANFTPTANTIILWAFNIPAYLTVSSVAFFCPTTDGTGLYDVGVYDMSGNLKLNIGGSAGIHILGGLPEAHTISQGTVTLVPGTYLYAITGNAAVAAFRGDSAYAYTTLGGIASSTAGGAFLPTSISVPTPSIQDNVQFPSIILY